MNDGGERDVVELLAALRQHAISPAELHYKEVEAVAYAVLGERLHEWTRQRVVSLERNRVGPIDIVARLRAFEEESPFASNIEELVYVECKHYKRSLSADSASKVFVESILHGPKLLLIISQTDLAPQAREYALRLFGRKGIFKATKVERWPLERLIWTKSIEADHGEHELRRTQPSCPAVLSWAVYESNSLSGRLLASSDMPALPKSLVLREDGAHLIAIDVSDFPASLPTIRCAETGRHAHLSWSDESTAGFGRLCCNLADLLAPGEATSELVVHADCPRTQSQYPLSLPTLHRPETTRFLLPELRSNAIESILARRNRLGRFAILCVHGTAGVGKSHLCVQASNALSGQENARVVRIPLGAGAGPVALLPLMLTALIGSTSSSDDGLPGSASELLRAVAMRLLPNGLNERELVARKVSCLELDSLDPEILLQLIVRALVESQASLVVHFSNCEQADSYMQRLIGLFAANLAANKTAPVTLLYEVRTPTDQDSVTEFIGDMAPGEVEQYVQKIPVNAVLLTDLRKAIDGVVLRADLSDVADSLHEKTGGNPLFLIHAIEYLIDRGYLRTHHRGGQSEIEVRDLPGLRKTIQELPGQLSFLLESRTRHLLTTHGGSELVRFAAVASLVGRQFSLNRIHDLLDWPSSDIATVLRRAQQLRVVRVTESGVSAAFVHDLMFAAIASVTDTLRPAREELHRVVDRLSTRRSYDDRLVGARALARLKCFTEAFEWGNDAFEVAVAAESLPDQASALTHCRKVLLADDATTETTRRQLVTIGVHLSDVEAQVGSQMEALRVIESTREQMLHNEDPIFNNCPRLSAEERTLELARLANREAIVHLRVFALQHATTAIATFATEQLDNNVDLGGRAAGLLGRVVLACAYSNKPSLAIAAARAALSHVSAPSDPDQLSALLSDIGRTYLLSSPEDCLALWELSTQHAESHRQSVHCALNLAVARAICHGTWLRDDESEELSRSIRSVGATNHACRLSLYEGVRAAVQGDTPSARSSFLQALRTARVTGLRYLEWQCHHNLAVLLQGSGESAEVWAHVEKAAAILEHAARIAIGEIELDSAINSLLPRFESTEASGGPGLVMSLPPAPPTSGGVLEFARCYRDMAERGIDLPQTNWRLFNSLADECPDPAPALHSIGAAFHLE